MCFIARSGILSESHPGDEKTESHNCPKVTKLVKDGGIGTQASCLSIRQGGEFPGSPGRAVGYGLQAQGEVCSPGLPVGRGGLG